MFGGSQLSWKTLAIFSRSLGTMLHSGGVSLDRSLPELSLSQPDLVRAIHRAYIAAGAQLIDAREKAFCVAKANGADDIVDVVVPRASIPTYMDQVSAIAT